MLDTIQSHLFVIAAGYGFSLFLGIPLRAYCGLPLRRWAHGRIRRLGERLNQRDVATRVWRGLILLVILLIPCLVLDWAIGSGIFAALLIAMIADLQPALWHGWAAVSAAKAQDNVRLAQAASRLALEAQTAPDHHGKLRLIITSLTLHFSIVLVGGAFWFALLGTKGLLAYYMLATASLYFREAEGEWRAFGWAATRGFALVDILPSLLSAVLLLLASLLVPKTRPIAGIHAYLGASSQHSLHLVAALLGIALGGPRQSQGTTTQTPWIGTGTAKLEGDDLARFMTLFSIALFGLSLALLYAISL